MRRKSLLYATYALYLTLLFEAFSYLSIQVLKDGIIFRSNYIPPKIRSSVNFHSNLGWTTGDERLNFGGTISCFGDSFTYGDEVEGDEAWPNLLNKKIIKTSNYGVAAYGVDQAYLKSTLEIENESKVFLLSFISENISRNLNVYRPFYNPGSRHYFTKPRFKMIDGKAKLIPNPIKDRASLSQLRSIEYLNRIREHDYFQPDIYRPPDDSFPYSRIFLNNFFWQQLYKVTIGEALELETGGRIQLWEHSNALKIQDHILTQFANDTKANGKLPIVMHLPVRGELSSYLLTNTIPRSVVHTKRFCEKLGLTCWFPIFEKEKWKSLPLDQVFARHGHYSPMGNRIIFSFVKSKIKDLQQQGILPAK